MSESNFARVRRRCSGGQVEARRESQAAQHSAEQRFVVQAVAVILFSRFSFCTVSDKEKVLTVSRHSV